MATWLLPKSDLAPDQLQVMELSPDRHRLICGVAGSGKTQVLIHRAYYLATKYNVSPSKYRIFVFTNVIKEYLRSGIRFLGLPDETVSTFDYWCQLMYEQYISRSLPKLRKSIDFVMMRSSVCRLLKQRPELQNQLDFILIDEGQDLCLEAFEITSMAARHITVFADWMQQIFEDGAKENQIQEILNIKKEDITMLGAYRNSPYVAQLASYFVMDERRRREYLSQIKIPRLSFERPLYYVATDHIDELNRLAEVVRQRQQLNQRVGLIVTKNKQVEELAAGLWSRGVKVEKAVSPRKQKLPVSFNFNNNVPKIATYHSAKGLTFDSVLLPSLTVRAFSHTRDPNLRRRMLFVGIARATQWVYLSTIKREEVEEFSLLKDAAARNHLTYQDGEVGRPGKKGSFIDDDFDSPL